MENTTRYQQQTDPRVSESRAEEQPEKAPETLEQEIDRLGDNFPALADFLKRAQKFFR